MKRRFVRRAGARLSYQHAGSGPPVTLIQGLGLPGAMWKDFAADLLDMGFSVTLPDNRGTGGSDVARPPYSVEQMADDVAAVMTRAHNEPSLVIGISMGGMIAQQLVLRHPGLCAGLLLVSTTPGLKSGAMARPDTYRLLMRMFLRPGATSIDDAQQLLAHQSSAERLPELFRRWDAVLDEQPTPARAFLGQLYAAARHEVGHLLERIELPVHVISGRDDRLIPPRNSIVIAERIRASRLTLVEEAGHLLPFERPAHLMRAFEEVANRSL